jgi:hypothetical protein
MGEKTRASLTFMLGLVLIAVVAGSAMATDYPQLEADYPADPNWQHRHTNYPTKPNGITEIKSVFGKPCTANNANVNVNHMTWKAADNGVKQNINFHKKLGGSTSSNLDWDVKGHVKQAGKNKYMKSGMGAYNCRKIGNGDQYSTHSWGIAVDVSWNYETQGESCHVITTASGVPDIWKNHRWTWGGDWAKPSKDCMHFQYASGY